MTVAGMNIGPPDRVTKGFRFGGEVSTRRRDITCVNCSEGFRWLFGTIVKCPYCGFDHSEFLDEEEENGGEKKKKKKMKKRK